MTYYLYHIPGKKVGVTRDLKKRVVEQQGYDYHEFEVLLESDDIEFISNMEIAYQLKHGYRVDEIPYNELKFNKDMNINITEQTTTFPCPVNKLKGQLMDNLNMSWKTEHGDCIITNESIKWIMKNVITSKYNTERCYVYNKAFARWFDNNNAHKTITGGIMSDQRQICKPECEISRFDKIRLWADDRGLYHKGDPKTQTLKLMEEAGEICRAVLKKDEPEIIDGIGDCVVVLTNLAHLCNTSIEECIDAAYDEIKNRTGKMSNGTFKKD
tara:strand:+ start:2183 stop:2992 length:810 start_codon:yes stop_codon:yes gene_type:complete